MSSGARRPVTHVLMEFGIWQVKHSGPDHATVYGEKTIKSQDGYEVRIGHYRCASCNETRVVTVSEVIKQGESEEKPGPKIFVPDE